MDEDAMVSLIQNKLSRKRCACGPSVVRDQETDPNQ